MYQLAVIWILFFSSVSLKTTSSPNLLIHMQQVNNHHYPQYLLNLYNIISHNLLLVYFNVTPFLFPLNRFIGNLLKLLICNNEKFRTTNSEARQGAGGAWVKPCCLSHSIRSNQTMCGINSLILKDRWDTLLSKIQLIFFVNLRFSSIVSYVR